MRILHTADFHLDSPFESLPPGKASNRRKEQRELLERVAKTAKEKNVDAVFLSGDLLDSDNSYYETGEELIRCLHRISAPVFIAPGNHDYYSQKSPYAKLELPDNVHVFKKKAIECIEIPQSGFRVFGAAYDDKGEVNLIKDFNYQPDDDILNIMCIHGNPGIEDIEKTNMDYVALGHIHKATGLKKAGGVFYSQPGCPEGRGFDETGEKYINIVDIERGSCSLEQVCIAGRKYEIREVEVSGNDPLLEIKMSLPVDTVRDIYRIILTGYREEKIDVLSVKKMLSEYLYELEIVDNTRLKNNVWDKCSDDSLRGLFLTRMKKQYDDALDDRDRQMIEQSVRWGLAAMDNMEEIEQYDN